MAYNNVKVKARQVVAQSSTQTKDLGTVSEVPMGEWNVDTPYKKLNLVRYNGATYIATQDNQGATPTGSGIWLLVNKDGRGITDTDTAYQAGISGITPPTGEWVNEVPTVPQGQYLWTRVIYTFTDNRQTVAYSVSLQGLNFTQQDRNDIDRITDAIPSTASTENPLATHDFVNSSINAMAAFYITYTQGSATEMGQAFPTQASLLNATTFYSGTQVRVPTQNDYATVLADETQPKGANGIYPTTRYVYQTNEVGGTYPNGQWAFQYVVNNTSLTQAQVDAINSGITKELVDIIGEGSVTSVNGQTGVVTLTPQDIGAVKIGGELTADLNTVVENGIYRVSTGSTNVPENKLYGQMLVMHQANTVAQLYVWYSDGSIYARAGNPPEAGGSGQWSDWYKVAKDSEVVHKSGDTMTGPLNCPFNNNFIVHGNEFNFIPQGYNNDVFFNYGGGAVGDYHFTNGDSNGGLANIRAADVYDHGQRVFSPHNLPTALKDSADGQAAYLDYGSRALGLNEFTYLACWSGHVVRSVNKKSVLPSDNGTDNGEGVVKYLSIPVIISLGSVVICYGRVSTSGSSAVFQDISFPVTYTYTPNVLTTYNGNNTGTIENLYGWVKQNSITTRGFTVRSYGGNSITYLAIGKIK